MASIGKAMITPKKLKIGIVLWFMKNVLDIGVDLLFLQCLLSQLHDSQLHRTRRLNGFTFANDKQGSTMKFGDFHHAVSPQSSVPLLDVNRGNAAIREEVLEAIARVVDSGRFLHGPEVGELECAMAGISQTKHAIACASGSDALLLALMALDIGPGDEVILCHSLLRQSLGGQNCFCRY
jgi:hypothetical protein